MSIIDILGVPHVYQLTNPVTGSSAPVLTFIHGWLLSHHYWQPLVKHLSPSYQCLIYDLRGFGDSQISENSTETLSIQKTPKSAYSLAAYAEDLKILLEKLNIEKTWLIGHSLGGSIALWGACSCSERVEGVICLNSGGGIYLKEEFERFRQIGVKIINHRPSWIRYLPLIDWFFAKAMVYKRLELYWGRQRVVDFIKANHEAALGSLLESTTESEVHNLPQVVAKLKQPVYFLAGLEDQIMEPKYVHHLASFHQLFNAGTSNVIEIPDCGHLSMLEYPEQVAGFINLILQEYGFLEQLSSSIKI